MPMKWSFLLLAPGILSVLYYYVRRQRLIKKLSGRSFCHDEEFWKNNYYEHDGTKVLDALAELSKILGVSFALLDPADKLSELTLSDELNSDVLDEISLLLTDKYGVSEKALRCILTVDDYIRVALGHSNS